METAEAKMWQTVEVLFDHFRSKPTYTRKEVAQGLGDVHFNTIYKDKLLLLNWCQPYENSLKDPTGKIVRWQRLIPYQVWLLTITRCLVHHYGKTKAASFLFTQSDKYLTPQKLKEFMEAANAKPTQTRHTSAA